MITWSARLLHPDVPSIVESKAVSVHGRIQVGYVRRIGDPIARNSAATWLSGAASFRSIHPASFQSSNALCIREGTIVGEARDPRGTFPYRWRGNLPDGATLTPDPGGQARAFADGTTGGLYQVDAHLWFPDGSSAQIHHEFDGTLHGQSQVNGMYDKWQVGTVWTTDGLRAYLWSGVAGGGRSLHPSPPLEFASDSEAHDIHGDTQVGRAGSRACLWRGTAESQVSLHPLDAKGSCALGTYGDVQVGWADFGSSSEACAWTGSPSSMMNLHAVLPSAFTVSRAVGVWSYPSGGITVVGWGINTEPNPARVEALLWLGRRTDGPPPTPVVIRDLPLHL